MIKNWNLMSFFKELNNRLVVCVNVLKNEVLTGGLVLKNGENKFYL